MANFGAPSYVATGTTTAPGASVVIADTGQMKEGFYYVEIFIGFSDTLAAGKQGNAQHRDGANGSTLHQASVPASGSGRIVWESVHVKDNERIRVINDTVVGAAGSILSASIRAYRR